MKRKQFLPVLMDLGIDQNIFEIDLNILDNTGNLLSKLT